MHKTFLHEGTRRFVSNMTKTAVEFVRRLTELGLSIEEVQFFGDKMRAFLMMSDARRASELEKITWWEYLEADTKSQAYRDLIGATTRPSPPSLRKNRRHARSVAAQ